MDFNILKGELSLPEYIGLSDVDTTSLLNIVNIPKKVIISTHDIQQYLVLTDLLLPIEDGVSDACRRAIRALAVFESFDVTQGMIDSKFTSIINSLVVDISLPTFTQAHADNILAMGDTLISRSEELNLGTVKVANVQFARSL